MDKRYDFLQLVRLGIGHHSNSLSADVDWDDIKALANQQGLTAIVLDGIEKLPKIVRPPKVFLLRWIGGVLQGYESRYVDYEKAIGSLAGFFNKHNLRMMVLKGYGLSLNYPNPKHRPCGDIDIWCFGNNNEADMAVNREFGIHIDKGHHIHTVFSWEGFTVENHYDLVNTYRQKRNRELNHLLKELAVNDCKTLLIDGQTVYFPSVKFNALFLLTHALAHFAGSEINLRQVLDWGFFVKHYSNEIDWEWLNEMLLKFQMKDFFDCLNAVCVDYLGFSCDLFPRVIVSSSLKERVLENIINPQFADSVPHSVLPRLIWKYRRWNRNAWKQWLCYNENRWSAFWNGVRSHLAKPSTI